ncbi:MULTISPECIES: CDGSH iron-sulfur domain-containing protein [unclassified Fusibacter]|uniref:CDGSH iron-sulfur domain-containing protein n=1 Tax=unclassified Fusibacter TaxID=2624464 RepID=UPI0013E90A5E|nr:MULTISPECIES: CDGSH iron-sulfur domain-containing protein [unclassified Fusibacter]MCK8061703.1 CDGSH iron-sulfur domain-containing protein [Fusibacter sp. A2]NPE23887.1 hypothetical protein [Fusibacter sp. A1]
MKIAKITATKNGPFKMTGLKKITRHTGEVISIEQEAYLCRCGGSSTKPFCDDTHKKNGFDGSPNPDYLKNKVRAYEGEKIIIYDNRSVCSHRGYCTQEVPNVFKKSAPWIDPDGDTVEKIIDLCNKCPSGALSYAIVGKGRVQGDYLGEACLRISERRFGFDGPYDLTGAIAIDGQTLRTSESPFKATLCRCGYSKNMPFCSGEHIKIEFIED